MEAHFLYRDPTAVNDDYYEQQPMSCLGDFGGPVDPNVALGGFPRKTETHKLSSHSL